MNLSRPGIALALLLLAGGLAATRYSLLADRSDFMVNDDILATAQVTPRVASAGSNGFVVAWCDDRTGNADIWLQRFDLDGNRLGENEQANTDQSGSYQAGPAIAIDYTGNYSIVWQDYRNGTYPFKPDIFFQGYDALLNPLGANKELTLALPDTLKENPDIDMAPWGMGVVVWSDYRNRNWDIYGQRITTNGELINGPFKINDDVVTAQQHAPRVSISPQGWFVVSWYDNRSGHDDIFAQVFDSAGVKRSVNFRVNSDNATSRQAFPDIAADGVGKFTVVWVDWRNGTYPANPDIYARKFDTMLVPVYSDRKINNDSESRAQRDPAIAADRRGNVAVIWADSSAGSWDIVGQMIDVDGTIQVANFRANNLSDSAQLQPSVALDGRRRYVAWVDRRNGEHDIYASVTTYNDPSLIPSSSALSFIMEAGGPLPVPQAVQLDHAGYNALHFTATPDQPWLTLSPNSGSTPASLAVAVNTSGLPRGTYPAVIRLTDTDNADSSQVITVTLQVVAPVQTDTIEITSHYTIPGLADSCLVLLHAINELKRVALPLRWDTALIQIDSVHLDNSWLSTASREKTLSQGTGELSIILDTRQAGLTVLPGEYQMGALFFTGKKAGVVAVIDTATLDTISLSALTADNLPARPAFTAGRISLSASTDVREQTDGSRPEVYALAQNYPNPCNAGTTIEYSLPSHGETSLEVFDILGHRVAVLVSGARSAGLWRVSWDGRGDGGAELPSGVYFYRLQSGEFREVRKLILLK